MKNILFKLLCVFVIINTYAQKPLKPNSVEIYNKIKKLNFLGSVLYVAAHPDDENTRLISYLSNDKNARIAYLSLTRGDGGQNLIGPELRELLGVIRTQELLEARKIDGGEQYFTRANDFGFSKSPTETLTIWDKEQVLNDLIWTVRKFRPDVIINRFDHRTPGTTHGHHTASAMLSIESFDLAAKNTICENQLKFVKPWQPKKIYYNTSWWFYGSKENFDKVDKSNLTAIPIGVYFENLGKSNQEIAALSRSCHKSQGFGTSGNRGEEMEYLELIKGDKTANNNDIFEGINTTWTRINGGEKIEPIINKIIKNFDFNNPALSLPDLLNAYELISKIDDEHWKSIKLQEIQNIIIHCAGLYIDATTTEAFTAKNSNIKVKLEVINRSSFPVVLDNLKSIIDQKEYSQNIELKANINHNIPLEINVPENIKYSNPYWLNEKGTLGMYQVSEQELIGLPTLGSNLRVVFNLKFGNTIIPIEREILYKYNDDVKGEIYEPFSIHPDLSVSFLDKVILFNKSKRIAVKIKAFKDNLNGTLKLNLPSDWKTTPESILFNLNKKNEESIFYFDVKPPQNTSEINVKCNAIINNEVFDNDVINIKYEHINNQQVLLPSNSKFIKLNVKIGTEKIAYIMGAGDEVPKCLQLMGYDTTILKIDDVTKDNLSKYDVVITGIRAYNVLDKLNNKQSILLDFVKNGKKMIVQYNTNSDLVTNTIGPFDFKISRERVTNENAKVTILNQEHPAFNNPNTITNKDFEGWKQEQGLYYPSVWSNEYSPLISSNDEGENEKKGGILVAKYGKGQYIYTSLSFFRQLPEGVPGAYKLIANLISY